MQRLNTVTNVSVHVFDRELKNIEAEEKTEDAKRRTGALCIVCIHVSYKNPSQRPRRYFSASNSNSTLAHSGSLCSPCVNGSSSYHLNPEVCVCVYAQMGRGGAEVGQSTLYFNN